jgi:predicted permease
MLLIGAGLLVRTLASLHAVDPGFDAHNLLTATVDIPEAKYATPAAREQFFSRVLENVRALPGVESASAVDSIPLRGGSSQPIAIEGQPPMPQSELPVVAVRWTMPGYFSTARIRVLDGRDFDNRDRADGKLVAIVSDLAAQRLWPNENPIGRHLTLGLMSDDPREVVGIVRQVKTEQMDEREPEPAVYLPSSQPSIPGTTLVIRAAVPPLTLSRAMIAAVQSVDPEQPVLNISTMETVIEESFGPRRFALLLLSGFALLALALASIGIYSVLAYSVRQRVREIGIRMALGAPSRDVVRMVVVEGCKPTIAGVVLGLVLAGLLARVMETLLFGVGTHDPGTFAAVATIVLAVGIIATLVPAFRATRVDPVVTLRSE